MISSKWIAVCVGALAASALLAFAGLWLTAPDPEVDTAVETNVCGLSQLLEVANDTSLSPQFRAQVLTEVVTELQSLDQTELSQQQVSEVLEVRRAVSQLNGKLPGLGDLTLSTTPFPPIDPSTPTPPTLTPTPLSDLAQPPAGPTSTPDPRPPC